LTPEADARTVRCPYCGLEAPVVRAAPQPPVPGTAAASPEVAAGPAAEPAAKSSAVGWVFVVLLAAVVGIAGVLVLATRSDDGGAEETPQAGPEKPAWDGVDGVALVDVNGDDTEDIVGRLEIQEPEHVSLLAAFDGASGKRIWITEPLGAWDDRVHAPLAVVEQTVLFADGKAGITAFDLRDGGVRWTIRLNEKIERFCAGTAPGSVGILTVDEVLHPVALADGAVQPAGESDVCGPVITDAAGAGRPDMWVCKPSGDCPRLASPREITDGMFADATLHHVSTGTSIALGAKEPGTSVPMVASFRMPPSDGPEGRDPMEILRHPDAADPAQRERLREEFARAQLEAMLRDDVRPEVLWTNVVPGGDPLQATARSPGPEQAALNGERLVVAYEAGEAHVFRFAAFDVADGARAWDVEVPGDSPLSGVAVSATHAMISRWGELQVFDLATGKLAYSIR
jgi:hypothetical protein